MKRTILAAAVVLAATPAFSKQIAVSGFWSAHYLTESESIGSADGTVAAEPMCVMRATWGKDGKDEASIYAKWSPTKGLFFHVVRFDWNFDAGIEVPMSMTWDRGVRDGVGRTFKSSNGLFSMIEILIDPKYANDIMQDMRDSTKLIIAFKSGNEPEWSAGMKGSEVAADAMQKCVKWIKAGRPSASTSPVAPRTTSPVPQTKRVPTSPVQQRRDNGSI